MVANTSSTRIGREAHRRLVEQHDFRVQHQRARHRQHLLLAARQGAGQLRRAAPSRRGNSSNTRSRSRVDVAARARAGQAREGAERAGCRSRTCVGEHAPAFRRMRQARAARSGATRSPSMSLAVRAAISPRLGADHARDGAHASSSCRRRWSRSGSRACPSRHLERDAVQHLHLAVAGDEVVDVQHGDRSARQLRPRRRPAAEVGLDDACGSACTCGRRALRRSSGRSRARRPCRRCS